MKTKGLIKITNRARVKSSGPIKMMISLILFRTVPQRKPESPSKRKDIKRLLIVRLSEQITLNKIKRRISITIEIEITMVTSNMVTTIIMAEGNTITIIIITVTVIIIIIIITTMGIITTTIIIIKAIINKAMGSITINKYEMIIKMATKEKVNSIHTIINSLTKTEETEVIRIRAQTTIIIIITKTTISRDLIQVDHHNREIIRINIIKNNINKAAFNKLNNQVKTKNRQTK